MANKFDIEDIVAKAHKSLNIGGLAQAIAARARVNIDQNNQIDSGVMRETIYIVTKDSDTYGGVTSSGRYNSSKTGYSSHHQVNGMADLGEADALIGIAADYTIFNELDKPFLYPALESAGDLLESVVEPW